MVYDSTDFRSTHEASITSSSGGRVSMCILNFTEELHMRPYMVTKRRCVCNKTFPFGTFHASFHNFHNVSIYVMKNLTIQVGNG